MDNGRWTDGFLGHASRVRTICGILHQGSQCLTDERIEKKFPICRVSYPSAQIFQEPITNSSGKVWMSTMGS